MGRNWSRRPWIFDRLVWTVLGYEVEIWGWKEREGIERMKERYLKWILGVDRRTPGYMIKEELQRDIIREKAGRRAWGFENKMEEGRGSELERRCEERRLERNKGGRESRKRKERVERRKKIF